MKTRDEVLEKDKWDLSQLYKSIEDWDKEFVQYKQTIKRLPNFKGTLSNSLKSFNDFLNYEAILTRVEEKLFTYISLRTSEDLANQEFNARQSMLYAIYSERSQMSSWIQPEILAMDKDLLNSFMNDELLRDDKFNLEKLCRLREHTPNDEENKILSMLIQARQTSNKAFSSLTNVDMSFGDIEVEGEKIELTQSSFSLFLQNPDREVRKNAYMQFYNEFDKHKNTLANLYEGSIHFDIFKSKIKRYQSSLEASLFPKNVSLDVYSNLVKTVNKHLPKLHKYYELRKKILNVDSLKHYDVYVPLISDIKMHTSYEDAVKTIISALEPLGKDYCNTLENGLLNGWVDKYENKGKRSGAFSSGCYDSQPYILMNYNPDVLRDVFTLAHEGGHSMHTFMANANNCYQNCNYTIFEAEVASTVNEQLLAEYLKNSSDSDNLKAYIIGKQIDDIIATLFRQTMFAEFELLVHNAGERNEALNLDFFRKTYRELLIKYFGSSLELESFSDLEGLRIPHFYRAFYVFQYATGISSAITIAKNILDNKDVARDKYFDFLKTGGSDYPLNALKKAGVDMSKPEPIETAIEYFDELVNNLKILTKN